MKTLLIKNLAKRYPIGKDRFFTALGPINLSFDSTGIVAINGKSGSGKSTLINLIARIDTPTEGEIYLYGRPYKSFNKRTNTTFFNQDIGIVFQNYNLIDEETVLYNVELPSLIKGDSAKKSKEKAIKSLKMVGIKEELFNLKASKLSGGEKQRVSIARAIVNDPKILLCDEPTGALDSDNTTNVMQLIKKISENTLVIMVSHNLQITKQYSDRIIEIANGQIVKDEVINKKEDSIRFSKKQMKRSSSWINRIASSNYKRRIKRNVFSSVALTIVLSMLYLVVGFINNKDKSIKEACYKQLDFGSGSVSKETSTGGSGMLSLTKSSRPDYESLKSNSKISEKYEICINFSAILPQNIKILYDDEIVDDLLFTPIYSFDRQHIDRSLIVDGTLPDEASIDEVIINQSAANLIRKEIGKNPLNEYLTIEHETETTYVTNTEEYVNDIFRLNKKIKIAAIVEEINYLPTPKIYYSYLAIEEYCKDYILVNLSTYNSEDITWYDRVMNADNNAIISSYSYLLFLKNFNDRITPFDNSIFGDGLVFTSQSMILTDSLFNFLSVAEYGVILFLVIAFVGALLILSIMSFTSFSEDHKKSAILSSIGASSDQIEEIYLQESMVNGFLSILLSVCISFGLMKLANILIYKYLDIKELIAIPFLEFLGIKFLFPLLIVLVVMLVVSFSTLIPISFSKRKSIKGELQRL